MLWWDWLSTAERLLRSLAEQTAALTLRDVARVERIQPELDLMLDRMRKIDERAAAATRELAEELGVQPVLRSLVAALKTTEAQQLDSLSKRVRTVGENVESALSKNRALIQNELTYVSGTLALIAKSAGEREGRFAARSAEPVLLDQVA